MNVMPNERSESLGILPLCVDLDGTITQKDTFVILLKKLSYQKPFFFLQIIFVLIFNKAKAKVMVSRVIEVDPKELPYQENFLAFLREEFSKGRKIYLATASHQRTAELVAEHLKIFTEIFATCDAKINLKSQYKAERLKNYFSSGQDFAYAGNSFDDIEVWKAAKEVIAVNVSEALKKRMEEVGLKILREFC